MYGKIFEEIFDSTIMQHGGDTVYIFMAMIVLSDSQGFLRMAPAALAQRIDKPVDIVKHTVEVLKQPDPDSNTPDYEGRRIIPLTEFTSGEENRGWWIVNKEKFKRFASREDRRDQNKINKQKERLRNADMSASVSNGQQPSAMSAHTDTDTDAYANKNKKSKARQRKVAVPKAHKLDDSQWLETLKSNIAYKHIHLEAELAKMDAWLTTAKGARRQKTRSFIISWLNRIEKPITSGPLPPSDPNDPYYTKDWSDDA